MINPTLSKMEIVQEDSYTNIQTLTPLFIMIINKLNK